MDSSRMRFVQYSAQKDLRKVREHRRALGHELPVGNDDTPCFGLRLGGRNSDGTQCSQSSLNYTHLIDKNRGIRAVICSNANELPIRRRLAFRRWRSSWSEPISHSN